MKHPEAIAKIRSLPSTKKEMKQFVAHAVAEIVSGEYSVIEIAGMLDIVKKTMDAILKEPAVKAEIDRAVSMYPEKTVDFGTFSITKATRTTWDYKHDLNWVAIKKELEERESAMQFAATQPGPIFDQDGVEIPKAIRKDTDYLTFRLK